MAQLSSPGVSVTVVDESFYTPSAPGTVPMIVIASEENKTNGAGTGTASGTLKINAGKVYLLTSQKDLSDTFGTPKFITDVSNNPIHAGEQNEYGLQAAYSYLGVSNRAYVVRADVDLAQLTARTTAPSGNPTNGTFWFETAATKFGIFEWNAASALVTGGQTFTVKQPAVITSSVYVDNYPSAPVPKSSFGATGSYAIVAVSTLLKLWYKKPITATPVSWIEVGTTEWAASWPVVLGTVSAPVLTSGDTISINTTSVTGDTLAALIIDINTKLVGVGITAAAPRGKLELYSASESIVVAGDVVVLVKLGLTAGTYAAVALSIGSHTQVPQYKSSAGNRPTGSIWVKTTSPNLGADWIIRRYNKTSVIWENLPAPLYSSNAEALAGIDSTGGGINLPANTIYIKTNDSESNPPLVNFKLYRRSTVGTTTIVSAPITASTLAANTTYSFTISETNSGTAVYSTPVTISVTIGSTPSAIVTAELILASLQNSLRDSNIVATMLSATNQISISHENGGDFKLVDDAVNPLLSRLFSTSTTANYFVDPSGTTNSYVASLWTSLSDDKLGGFAIATGDAPVSSTPDGELWYDSIVDEVDILIHNGTTWVGYLDATAVTMNHAGISGETDTDPAGPLVKAVPPTTQSDGTPLANGDIWVSTADTENYPMIYRYNRVIAKWVLLDNSDQTTENGVLFHDVRWDVTGQSATASPIRELLSSNFIDFDAPDPALYPMGMLLWNLRRSGNNVKRFVVNYVDVLGRNRRFNNNEPMHDYYPHKWVTEAGNQEDGSGTFGRRSQRKVVVQALQALVNSNQQIRDEDSRVFNLLACPGYPELVGELIGLNTDRGLTAFVVADAPARLTADATSLSNWGNNTSLALEDNDKGLVSYDEYMSFFYPWGYSSDNLGNNVVVPPSHMMLRTIALSDNVSYPWFAPSGTRRGGINNASSVGYVDAGGEFQAVALNTGQRDTLASIKVNPLSFITGSGLVNYGQLTRARNASALDRINVARLVIYLRRQLTQLSKPYIFEPNDKITRDQLKQAVESLMLELVGQRALYDFIVVCDTSNNTPARIDRSELYLDIAIEPVKAVEFIYIPLRLQNTGEIKGKV